MKLDWSAKGIDISKARGGKTFCPNCHHTRKNKRDPSLSIDLEKGLYNCHNGCGFSGTVQVIEKKKEYQKPLPRLTKVTPEIESWFNGRKVSNTALLSLRVTHSAEWMPECQDGAKIGVICFNYYRGEELVNIKYRSGGKGFRLERGAELIFYNLNALSNREEIVIVEGEIDCLSVVECGYFGVVSVPNGASLSKNAKLEYLDNCWQDFEHIKRIIIAVDNDEAGNCLKDELIRRFGSERCLTVEYPEGCKDANEVLCKHGKEAVLKMIAEAKELPIEGIDTVYDNIESLKYLYQYGYPEAARIDYTDLNELITWKEGDFTIVTGTPNAGKSTWVNNVVEQLVRLQGWKVGMFAPEKMPVEILIAELAQIHIGKPFYRKNPSEKMTVDEMTDSLAFVDENFYFIKVNEIKATVEGILSKAKEMIKRFGIKVLVIDPWNYIEHHREKTETETEYVSRALTMISVFAKQNKVHIIIVAHPTKIKKNKEGAFELPSLYDISGSAHFFNKCDNGIVVYRDYKEGCNTVHVQKVRWFFVGKVGSVKMYFDPKSQRFTEHPPFQYGSPQPVFEHPYNPNAGLPGFRKEETF